MRVIKNINSANVCTLLGNKGADMLCAALDSLTKKDEKNIANYLGSVLKPSCKSILLST